MILWNVSSGTGITWICAPDVSAVTEKVNTSDGQRMTGWPHGWLQRVGMEGRERKGGREMESRARQESPCGPVQPGRLRGARTGLDCSTSVPPLSASVGLLQPLCISVWHRLVSFWEQTEIRTSRGRGRGRGVSRCLLPKACVSIDGFIFFKAFCFYIPSPFSQK